MGATSLFTNYTQLIVDKITNTDFGVQSFDYVVRENIHSILSHIDFLKQTQFSYIQRMYFSEN